MDLDRRKFVMRFFAIFFFVIGMALLIFIGSLIYGSYNSSIKDVNSTKESSDIVLCNQLYLNVEFTATGDLLIENNVISSVDLDHLVLVDTVTAEEFEKSYTFFKPGMERELAASVIPFEKFYIFPKGCDEIWHLCDMNEKTCTDSDTYFSEN